MLGGGEVDVVGGGMIIVFELGIVLFFLFILR